MKEMDSYLDDDLAGSSRASRLIVECMEAHKDEPPRRFLAKSEREK